MRLIPILLAAALIVPAAAVAEGAYRYTPVPDDRSVGKVGAPVTVIEYGSVACPHCAAWDKEVFPAFKAKYVDTGKVRFVFREMLTGNPQLAAAGFITARCAPPNKYFDVVHALMDKQEDIYRGGQLRAPLLEIAKSAGLSESTFDACLNDQKNFDAVSERSNANAALDKVDGTPAFVVNGVKLDGEQTLEALDKAISTAAGAKSAKAGPAPKKK